MFNASSILKGRLLINVLSQESRKHEILKVQENIYVNFWAFTVSVAYTEYVYDLI